MARESADFDIPNISSLTIDAGPFTRTFKKVFDHQEKLQETNAKIEIQLERVEAQVKELREVIESKDREIVQQRELLNKRFELINPEELPNRLLDIDRHLGNLQEKFKDYTETQENLSIDFLKSKQIIEKIQDNSTDSIHKFDRLTRDIVGLKDTLIKNENDVKSQFEEKLENISEKNAEMESKFESKHVNFLNEVKQMIDMQRGKETEKIEDAVSKQIEISEKRVNSMVSYALNVVTQCAADWWEKRNNHRFFQAWRERAWIGARQRNACILIRRIIKNRLTDVVFSLRSHANLERHLDKIKKSFISTLPDVDSIILNGVGKHVSQVVTKIDEYDDRLKNVENLEDKLKSYTEDVMFRML
eukprot:GHVL01022789.1.p3 GENE.GHVL01022789.1~~GHVL01022789.1.p3  ORF type:complete len:361 (-),score=87.68 GHVL01022789.1:4466-5548(-)